ncbi:UdgX family uracil-DNA binding protein [Ahrensia sp. R2A130]|uniref:UdgX family uracil-DNA binding protein n=1 Tax=Ahrensia sp. R2A130 TaxID=744979 RepID=UPI0001E0A4C3|nr:UdgX family uracil-DNA binding protein [Ahrensia sp. R2A130]EFL88421.1 uracil-DNA glycosylase:Phage SPO1 DNA polymerase-related protein [Ahrensia sp. R2A130]
MLTLPLQSPDDFEGWRAGAKQALAQGLSSADVLFQVDGGEDDLFGEPPAATPSTPTVATTTPTVPKAFIDLARNVVCHSDSERFALLYRLLLRLQSERSLMAQPSDPDVWRASRLAKEIRRDAHKMKAFVRFRKTGETVEFGTGSTREQFVAWFEPTHNIVRHTSGFFMRRFTGMDWSILTPRGCAHWDGKALTFSPAVDKSQAPADDALEDYWRTYYASIFNPARLKTQAMQSEMPKKYWKNLPEAALIPDLIKSARERENMMVESEPTAPNPALMRNREMPVPTDGFIHELPPQAPLNDLGSLNDMLKNCRACPLWQPATQTVCGAGTQRASIMLVGEQPGDNEDLQGQAFIGPAGKILEAAFEEVGIDRADTWLTNAVKHFKFEPRGKRRIHQNPSVGEIDHCSWWLQRELALVQPRVVVALGASAVRGLTGKTHKLGDLRGNATPLASLMKKGRELPLELSGLGGNGANDTGVQLVATYHPSYILRVPNEQARADARTALLDGLRLAKELAA